WNGYFGKDRFNADQESYYVFDDWANEEFNFFPDSTNSMRRGLGFRVTARGLQWSNVLVEDILFMLYDVKNIGTHLHDRVVFGYKFGMGVGASSSESDNNDDGGKYLLDEDLAISFDVDDAGKPGGWTPVGMIGFSFLESPGNAIDGIDNDQDGQNGTGMLISEETFAPKILNRGDDIVFIDYKTFERYTAKAFEENLSNQSFSMDQDSIKIFFLKKVIAFTPGDTLQEVTMEHNIDNIDNNLNGLIDEGKGSIFGIDPRTQVKRFLYVGNLSVDYLTGLGQDNLLIDERRDDGIDNNNNWEPLDDVGLDGNKNEMDTGQGDGFPTSGWQNGIDTEQPGEPHIDKTDINESDMIGLTSFELLKPYTVMPLYDDERVWKSLVPGYLDDIVSIGDDTDISFGSGYFAMFPEQIERFSLSFQLAYTEENLIRIKNWGALAYAENYQFATAPNTPTLQAIAGDKKVTLIWNSIAEKSFDPLEGYDFEGYRIYRSTDALWSDMEGITDGYGNIVYRKPLAIFDLVNEYSGFYPIQDRGLMFNLGDNSGITHSWVDTTVTNGIQYYYAVTAYDHGSPSYGIPPTETPIVLNIDQVGGIESIGPNAARVVPGANAPGMTDLPDDAYAITNISGRLTENAYFKVVDQREMRSEHTYQLTFKDSIFTDAETNSASLKPYCFKLMDMSEDRIVVECDDNVYTPGVFEGLEIFLEAAKEYAFNRLNSGWSRSNIYEYDFGLYEYREATGVPMFSDFRIDFGEIGIATSTYLKIATRNYDAKPVNFTITDLQSGESVPFAFYERDKVSLGEGAFTSRISTSTTTIQSDEIIFLKKNEEDADYSVSWCLQFIPGLSVLDTTRWPVAGDFIEFIFDKPFTSADTLIFTTPKKPEYDANIAKVSLDKIRVAPNPYIVSNEFEPVNYYDQGRGDRHLHFINLPPKCTIRIYTMSGQLVKTITHNVDVDDRGEEIWDMLTKENMDIGFGVYFYHVDAGEYGTRIDKFAIIK
ncbi:hypothetical protein JW824_01585, partial [bacterium]|nr:hypothetical protein [bacterium]